MKKQTITLMVGIAVAVASAAYFGLTLFQVSRVPDHSDWQKAAEMINSEWADEDLVAFSPQWAQGACPWLQGLEVDTGETPDWYNASLYKRVWLIESMNGKNRRPPEEWNLLKRKDFGKVAVSLWNPPKGQEAVYSFRDRIKDARVTGIRGKGSKKFCTNFKNNRWYCGRIHPWKYVGLESRDIAGRVRDIIWAHAINKSIVDVTWPNVERGSRLTVHYGLTQRAAEAHEGADTIFRILLNGKVLFEDILETDEHGWFRKDFNFDGTGHAKIGFQVETPDAQSRQVCFTAEVWK